MDGWLLAALFVALTAWVMWAIVRADMKDQAAYDRWYEDPRQVWNGGRGNIGRR